MKGGELKYHLSKLEFLALKWAIMDQFKEYLQYQIFKVKTKNNCLTYVMMMSNLDTVGLRWFAAMVGYNAQENKSYWNLTDSYWVITQQGNLAIHLIMEWLRRRKDDHCTLDQYLKNHIADAK